MKIPNTVWDFFTKNSAILPPPHCQKCAVDITVLNQEQFEWVGVGTSVHHICDDKDTPFPAHDNCNPRMVARFTFDWYCKKCRGHIQYFIHRTVAGMSVDEVPFLDQVAILNSLAVFMIGDYNVALIPRGKNLQQELEKILQQSIAPRDPEQMQAYQRAVQEHNSAQAKDVSPVRDVGSFKTFFGKDAPIGDS